VEGCGIRDELIAEAVEALVCKTITRSNPTRASKLLKIKGRECYPGQRLTSTTSLQPSSL
jgi:hypothetical protein